MLKHYKLTVAATNRAMDVALVAGLWLASFWLRFHVPLVAVTKGFPAFSTYAALTPLVIAIWGLVFQAHGVYEPRRFLRGKSQAGMLLRAHVTALLCFIALTYIFSEYRYSRGVLVYFALFGGAALVIARQLVHNLFALVRRRSGQRGVLLVGEGPSVELLIRRIDRCPELGIGVVGVLVSADSSAAQIGDKPVVGRYDEVVSAIERTGADQVLVALPRQQWSELEGVLAQISEDTVDVQIIPDIHEFVTIGCQVEDFDGMPVVRLNPSPLMGWSAFLKRTTDVILSTAALVLVAPVMLAIAAIVKATSKGPIIYGQDRMGLDGRVFRMYKFRTMRQDAEASSGPVWARPRDDRRTPVGSFLRSTSLDELPQFWNVLTGDMSLVGPRPERPVFVQQFRRDISHYMLRHKVKAGITGWAQVSGWRGNTSLDARIRCDLDYIRDWTLFLDLKILLLTVWKGFVNKNAY
jgi:Undecaprenyl-phosphate glucose phosphotransferase